LWNLAGDGQAAASESILFGGHEARVNRARFDAAGRCVVTACGDGRVRVFDAGSGAELCRYEVGTPINDAAFDPEAQLVLLCTRSTTRIWDFSNRFGTVSLRHPSFVNAVAAAGADKIVTASDDKLVRVFRARTGERIGQTRPLDEVVTAVAVDGMGERMAIGTWSGHLAVHSVWNCEPLFELDGHKKPILTAAFGAGGTRLLSASADSARVWNAVDASTVLVHKGGSNLCWAAISPDATLLATVEVGATAVQLWSVADGQQRATLGAHDQPITCVAFRADGKALLSCSQDTTAKVWGLGGELLATLRTGMPLTCGAFADDGRRVLLGGGTAREQGAQLWDQDQGIQLLRFQGQHGQLTSCAFSHDGQWAITGSRDRSAYIWPTDPVAVARRLPLRQLTADERSSFDLPPLPNTTTTDR
jgi:WD40 repeat protein